MQRMPVWIGAAQCLSAMGDGLPAHVERLRSGGTALREWPTIASKPLVAGRVPADLLPDGPHRAQRLLDRCLSAMLLEAAPKSAERWMLVLASTKGDIEAMERGDAAGSALPLLGERMRQRCGRDEAPAVISLACASGTTALIHACTAIEQGHCDHALVVGIDVLSRFVLDGFASLYALDAVPCRPFDEKRAGTSLGEGCAGIVASRDRSRVPRVLGRWIAGAIAHDANHISGPSRTGEGLLRAVQNVLRQASMASADISAINAHGTGTPYNDAMESIAFERAGLSDAPLSCYKGWFGHTLGAAGLLEAAIALHALRDGWVLRTEGLREVGVPGRINVIKEDVRTDGRVLLKTSSGFGGCNAAMIIEAA